MASKRFKLLLDNPLDILPGKFYAGRTVTGRLYLKKKKKKRHKDYQRERQANEIEEEGYIIVRNLMC